MTALVIQAANEETSTHQPFVIAFGVGIAGLLLLWLVRPLKRDVWTTAISKSHVTFSDYRGLTYVSTGSARTFARRTLWR
jgi:hypothetical protein